MFTELVVATFNANNAGSVTAGLDVSTNNHVSFQVIANSGSHDDHELTLEHSTDNTNWESTGVRLTGTGIRGGVPLFVKFARLKLTIAEGSASEVKLIIQGK